MARLIAIPIRKRGDCVLIVTRHAGVELIGFVARTTLATALKAAPSMYDCMTFVEHNLPAIEQVLFRKSQDQEDAGGSIPCVEIVVADLAAAGIALTHP